jgi:hypothetical protein
MPLNPKSKIKNQKSKIKNKNRAPFSIKIDLQNNLNII